MKIIKCGQDYEKHFDPDRYLTFYYSKYGQFQNMVDFMTKTMHQVFSDGYIGGKDLLDVGSGPTIHSIISASSYVDNIYLSDFANQNLSILNSWLRSERPLQENIVQQVCNLENKGESVQNRVDQIRKKVKGIFHIDILNVDSLDQINVSMKYDVITSSHCLDAAVSSREDYLKCLNNVKALLSPGGYFVNIGDLHADEYNEQMDDITFKGLDLNSNSVQTVHNEAGFQLKFYKEFNHVSEGSIFALVAQRKD